MHMIKAVIFDKDGTLHDTEKVFGRAWRLAAEELGVPDIETTLHDCTGMALPAIADYWAAKYPDIPFSKYLPRRSYHFDRILEDGVPVKDGAYELLEYLTAHGYRVGLATSTEGADSLSHLARTDMIKYFDKDAIITGDMVEHGKPAPDIYLLAAARLGVDPADCIGVEDSNNGVRAIFAAGMRPVMIPDVVEPAPDVTALAWRQLSALSELIPLLEAERREEESV